MPTPTQADNKARSYPHEVCRGPWALVALSSGTRLLGLEMQSMSPFLYVSECQLKKSSEILKWGRSNSSCLNAPGLLE